MLRPGSRYFSLIFTGCTLVASVAWAWPYSVDDAYILFRYAERLRDGFGYTYNAGPATDGVTGPLWLGWLALGGVLGANVPSFAKLSGAVCMGAAVLWVVVTARRQALGRLSAWLTAAIAVSAVPVAAWGPAGLETGAATLLSTAAVLAAVQRPGSAGVVCGLGAGLALWLRPELAGAGAVCVAVVLLRALPGGARRAWAAVGLLVAFALGLLAFRQAAFGHWLPLSYHAKPAILRQGAQYLAQLARRPSAVWLAPVLFIAALRGPRADRALCAVVAAHSLCVLLAGGDWMPGGRLMAPVVPAVALVAGRTLARAWARARRLSPLRATLALSGFGVLMLRAVHGEAELSEVRRAGLQSAERTPALVRRLLATSGPIAMVDVGAVGHRLPGRRIIDLAGLTEPAVAYARGAHLSKEVDSTWLRAQGPGAIVLHSRERPRVDTEGYVRWFSGYPVERRVLAFPWVLREYRASGVFEHSRSYFYVVLVPRARE